MDNVIGFIKTLGTLKQDPLYHYCWELLTRVPCNAEKVADVVEEVSRRCDVIHQDAGNLNKIEYIITSPGPG